MSKKPISDVDVEKIMESIRKRIQKRGAKWSRAKNIRVKIKQDLNLIKNNWDVENLNYQIFSHRKFIGPLLITGRELVHGEVRRYVDPALRKQSEFNAAVVRILNYLLKKTSKNTKRRKKLRNKR